MQTFMIKNWKFKLEENQNAWQKDFFDENWEDITVPHDWSIQQEFSKTNASGTGYLAGGIAWYRTHISLEKIELTKKIIQLCFEGVYKNTDIWVNGYHLGYRPSGYSSIYHDITEIISLRPDNDLVIAVRVDHSEIADSRWYNGSGITRPVKLEVVEEVFLDRYAITFTTEQIINNEAKISLEAFITNASNHEQKIKMIPTLHHKKMVDFHFDEKSLTISSDEKQKVTFQGTIKNPRLWCPDSPNLYQLNVQLEMMGNTIVYSKNVGIRTCLFDANQGFSINGQSLKLKGVCLHEDAGCFGTAVPTVVWLRRLLKLKKMGCNAIRMAHNPHAQNLYDLCDSLGFLVIDEAFDEWENPKNKWWQGHNVYPPKFEGYAKDFSVWYKKDLADMIERNKNHPSIIAWSIGNELDYPNDPYANTLVKQMIGNNDENKPEKEQGFNPNRPDTRYLTSIAKKLSDLCHQLDKTRPVTLAIAFPELSTQTGLLDPLDLIGYNYKEEYYAKDHKRFPGKPFIGSENSHKYSNWLAVLENEYISGQFLWTGIDYLGEAKGWPLHGSDAGLLTLAGFEKNNYYLRQSWWSQALMVKLFTRLGSSEMTDSSERVPVYRKWNYEMGDEVEVRCYTNGDTVQLMNDGQEVPLTFNKEKGYYQAKTIFEGEDLIVTAKSKDQTETDRLSAQGEAQRLMATNWQNEGAINCLKQQGIELEEEIYQIELEWVDSSNERTMDEKIILFKGEGCQLLGFENGDLSDNTAYTENWRRSYDGQLICYLKIIDSYAKATFTAKSFKPLELEFKEKQLLTKL